MLSENLEGFAPTRAKRSGNVLERSAMHRGVLWLRQRTPQTENFVRNSNSCAQYRAGAEGLQRIPTPRSFKLPHLYLTVGISDLRKPTSIYSQITRSRFIRH